MKRKDEIEGHLATLEAVLASDPDRMEEWHRTSVPLWRKHFDARGDLNERQFEALERVRHKVSPPKLGKANTPLTNGPVTPVGYHETSRLHDSVVYEKDEIRPNGPVVQETPFRNPEDPFTALSELVALHDTGSARVTIHGHEFSIGWCKAGPHHGQPVPQQLPLATSGSLKQALAVLDIPKAPSKSMEEGWTHLMEARHKEREAAMREQQLEDALQTRRKSLQKLTLSQQAERDALMKHPEYQPRTAALTFL